MRHAASRRCYEIKKQMQDRKTPVILIFYSSLICTIKMLHCTVLSYIKKWIYKLRF